MEMTTEGKLKASFIEHTNPKKLIELLNYKHNEAVDKLKKQPELKDFRFTQGQLNIIDDLLEVLNKATS